LPNNGVVTANITGSKSYMLLKVTTNVASWIRIYTDDSSRTADVSRSQYTDPTPGSGVLAEVITSGSQTVILTPAVLGYNNENPVTTDVPIRVTNLSGSASTVTVTLTYIQLES
jgi:hypothetical protein